VQKQLNEQRVQMDESRSRARIGEIALINELAASPIIAEIRRLIV
jgi:hypothetical protein